MGGSSYMYSVEYSIDLIPTDIGCSSDGFVMEVKTPQFDYDCKGKEIEGLVVRSVIYLSIYACVSFRSPCIPAGVISRLYRCAE